MQLTAVQHLSTGTCGLPERTGCFSPDCRKHGIHITSKVDNIPVLTRGNKFYVDFETASGMNDDFTTLLKQRPPLIFMSECGAHGKRGVPVLLLGMSENES